MKKVIILLLTSVLFAGVLSSCDGKKPATPEGLVLKADKYTVAADGTDINFTVTLDGADVTKKTQVCEVDKLCLTGHTTSFNDPADVGTHNFYASYDVYDGDVVVETIKSKEIVITVTAE